MSKHHTAHGLLLVLQGERKNFLTQLLCVPQAVPRTAVLSSLPGWMVCHPAPSPEEFGSCMALVFSSSYWIGLSNTGLSFLPTSASIHGLLGDWEYQEKWKENEATLDLGSQLLCPGL